MRRLALVTSIAILVPSIALATFTKPSDVLMALQLKGKPLDIAYEAHGGGEGMFVSAWLNGAVEGNDVETAKADMRLTVDFSMPSRGNLRARVLFRMLNKVLYVRLDELSGSFQDEIRLFATNYADKQWYSISMEDLKEQQEQFFDRTVDEGEAMLAAKRVMDAMLSLQAVPSNTDTVYSIRFKRNAAAELAKILPQLAKQYPSLEIDDELSPREVAELRKILSKINFHIKGTFAHNDEPKGLKFYVAAKHEDMEGVLQGTATVRSQRVKVTAPANAISLDELAEEQRGSARDAQRRSDVNTILNAVYQYAIDNNGEWPTGIGESPNWICRIGHSDPRTYVYCGTQVDLSVLLESYLVAIPVDPLLSASDGNQTGYRIWKDANGRVTVDAPDAEGADEISVTR